MDCRRIKRQKDKDVIVWFGSYGKNEDGTAKFYNAENKHDNFSSEQDAVADSLTQSLSILEGELWYNINFGLPLINKVNNKVEMDAAVLDIILGHEDVQEVTSFESEISQNNFYFASFTVQTTYGLLSINI